MEGKKILYKVTQYRIVVLWGRWLGWSLITVSLDGGSFCCIAD